MHDDLSINLSASVREQVDSKLLEIIHQTEDACTDRNDQLVDFRLQRLGISNPARGPWPNACQMESTLSAEEVITVASMLYMATSSDPIIGIADNTVISGLEAQVYQEYINQRARDNDYDRMLFDLCITAAENRFAPCRIDYDQEIETVTEDWLIYDDIPQPPDTIPEDVDKDTLEVQQVDMDVVKKSGFQFTSILPWNCHWYPLASPEMIGPREPQLAWSTVQYTRDALIAGIDNQGFDSKTVWDMIRDSPDGTSTNRFNADQNDRDGVHSASDSTGMYDCRYVIGKIPWVHDGEKVLIPKELQSVDCVFMFCPDLNKVLKATKLPGGIRNMAISNMLRTADTMLGECVCSLLQDAHNELTAFIRMQMDSASITCNPMLKVSEATAQRFGAQTAGPGKQMVFIGQVQGDLEPVRFDNVGLSLIPQFRAQISSEAQRIIGASGISGLLEGKVRKEAEVGLASGAQAVKSDLFLCSFAMGMVDHFRIMAKLLAEHEPDGAILTRGEIEEPVHIDHKKLAQACFVSTATAEDVNPVAKMERLRSFMDIFNMSPYAAYLQQKGDFNPFYQLLLQAANRAGLPDPKSILGEPPVQGMEPTPMPEPEAGMAPMGMEPTQLPMPPMGGMPMMPMPPQMGGGMPMMDQGGIPFGQNPI